MCSRKSGAPNESLPNTTSESKLSGHRENLRKRFAASGLDGLLQHEIVEFLLTFCIPRRDVKPHAKALLGQFKTIHNILNADEAELIEICGVGHRTAQFIRLIGEIALLYARQSLLPDKASTSDQLQNLRKYWKVKLSKERTEQLEIALLDNRMHPLPNGLKRLNSGCAGSVSLIPREIIKEALLRKCAAIAICHNHPNGDLCPSEHDERLTRILQLNLHTVGVRLLDHFIVADGRIFSILEQMEILGKA